jgi:hypothetical protein
MVVPDTTFMLAAHVSVVVTPLLLTKNPDHTPVAGHNSGTIKFNTQVLHRVVPQYTMIEAVYIPGVVGTKLILTTL